MNRALRQAWLLAGMLAVIAGLLGMHVLTAGHASHGPVAQGVVSHSAASHTAPAGHTAVVQSTVGDHPGHTGHAAAAASMDAPALAPATCGTSCPGAQESGAPCVLSVPGSPVAVFPPQATLAVAALLTPARNPSSSYGYLPPSPSPCDLSISRT